MARPKRHKPEGWPKYMKPAALANGVTGYYWQPPSWARKQKGCPQAVALGTDYAAAKHRCDTILNPGFKAWRTGGEDEVRPAFGTFHWMAAEYRKAKRFKRLAPKDQRDYDRSLAMVGKYKLKDGRELGKIELAKIDRPAAQKLYDALVKLPAGELRATTINRAMRHVRAAWNVVARRHGDVMPAVNPFEKLELERSTAKGGAKPATRAHLMVFIGKADDMGLSSIGTLALLAFELTFREPDLLRFTWSDWRPEDAPGHVIVRHRKTGEEYAVPLQTEDGALLFPELEARLGQTRRRGPIVAMRDQGDRAHDENSLRRLAAKVRKHAELPAWVWFSSFRKGGMTEMGDSKLTDAQIIGLSGHKTRQMISVYSKATERLRLEAAKQRLQYRSSGTDKDHLSE